MAGNGDQLTIRLMGAPHWPSGGAFFPAKGYILVAALLLAPGQMLTRQVAASLLWEDVEQKRALGNLRQLLSRMQDFAGPEDALILIGTGGLSAGPRALRSDLWHFLQAMRADTVEARSAGLLLMSGELLQGCETGGEQLYLWLLAERIRLKDLFFATLSPVLEDMTRFGGRKSDQIAGLAGYALALEPEREETYRQLMTAYARAGDISASDQLYDGLTRMLRAEARPPEPETLALRRRIKAYVASNDDQVRAPQKQRDEKPRVAFMLPMTVEEKPSSPIIRAFIEDVANSLARYRTFAVLAPHSSYVASEGTSGKEKSLRADYRVRTTVLTEHRASVALVDIETAEILWSLEVVLNERHLTEAFNVLSKQVAAALAEQMERRHVDAGRRQDANAYVHLLTGQQLIRGKCDLPLLRRARAEFRKAIDIDAGMALARARIAQTLQLEWLMLGGGDPHLLHRAKAEAEASVEIDVSLSTGHWMAAVIALYQRDFDASADRFLEAEALAPNSADLLLQHADALAHFGQAEHAWQRFQQAIDLNPLAPDIYWWAGASIAFKREDYAGAVALCRRMEDDEPALRVLTASLAMNGDIESARDAAQRLQENYPGMTARQICGLSPDREPEAHERFHDALKMAGLK